MLVIITGCWCACVSLVPLKIFPSILPEHLFVCHNRFLLAYWNFRAQFFVGFVWMSLQICLNMMFCTIFTMHDCLKYKWPPQKVLWKGLKVWKVSVFTGLIGAYNLNNNNNNNLLHLYSTSLDTQSALHSNGGISSSTTSVQHPPDDVTAAIVRQNTPHTPAYWWRGDSDEVNQCMGMIRRPWWSEDNGEVWPGHRGYTSTLFRRTSWDF